MDVGEFERGLIGLETPRELWNLILQFFARGPIQYVLYHHVPPMGAADGTRVKIFGHGLPEDFLHLYSAGRLYSQNPRFQRAFRIVEPFYFDEALVDASPEQLSFLEMIRGLDFDRGLGVPVFGPMGRNGYAGLGFVPGVERLSPEMVLDVQWACQLAHLRYCEFLLEDQGPPPRLSARETEVLGWVARGKSNTSIAGILGISAHTVDAHLRRIYDKLGVFDRISAAIRGIGTGLIHADC